MKTLLGIKKGMTRVYAGDKVVPVTVVDVEGCVVSNVDAKGFEIGIGKVKEKKAGKALIGKYKSLGFVPAHKQYIAGEVADIKIGDNVAVEFEEGAKVKVSATSKGKGFAGVVKRWGFAGGPKTHGQSDRHRAPGSIGAGTDPGRVIKGLKMAGRMGGEKVTMLNKKVVAVHDNLVLIAGSIPGSKGSVVVIEK